jgi:hypothetical protein
MRLEFTSDTTRSAFNRSLGICECHLIPWLDRPEGCGTRLGIGNIFYEHINPDAIRPDNTLDNCAILCKTCFREKTDHYDHGVIAKSNRTRDRARGIRRIPFRPLIGTIASGWKKYMDGRWQRRERHSDSRKETST